MRKMGYENSSVYCILGFIGTIILYPIITCLVALMIVGILLTYPVGRKLVASSLYDFTDEYMTSAALIYINLVKKLLI